MSTLRGEGFAQRTSANPTLIAMLLLRFRRTNYILMCTGNERGGQAKPKGVEAGTLYM